jgi:hypothetical protein
MKDIKILDIQREDFTSWYEVSLAEDRPVFILRINRALIPELFGRFKPEIPLFKMLQGKDKPELGDFVLPTNTNWGYGEVLQGVESPDLDFLSWEIEPSPVVFKDGIPQWKCAFQVSGTLTLLSIFLNILDQNALPQDLHSKRKQLISIITTTGYGFYGCSINCKISRCLCQWISKSFKPDFEELIIKAMRKVYYHMHQEQDSDEYMRKYYFRFDLRENGRFHLDCPGNACGLDPSHMDMGGIDEGFELSPHNTDTPSQQLTLLAGLAKICDLYRQENL